MKNRVVEFPGRYRQVAVPGQPGVYDFIPVPGEIHEPGTAINKENLLTDETAQRLGLDDAATPNEALGKVVDIVEDIPTEGIARQFIRPAPPIDGVDVDYPVGAEIFIPATKLHNLVKNPALASTDGWRVTNGTSTLSGGSIIITGGNGAAYIRLEQDITAEIGGHEIFAQGLAKLGNIAGLQKLSIRIVGEGVSQVIKEVTEVTANTYAEMYDIVTADERFTGSFTLVIEALFDSAASANGKIFTVTEPCIVDISNDFPAEIFGEGGRLTGDILRGMIASDTARTGRMFEDVGYWFSGQAYTKQDGETWIQGQAVSHEVSEKFDGAETVNDVLSGLTALPISSYLAWIASTSTDSLDAAFGKSNEKFVTNIGKQLALYAWFKGLNKKENQFVATISKNTLSEIADSIESVVELESNIHTKDIIRSSPYARSYSYTHGLGEYVLFDTNKVNIFGAAYTQSSPSNTTVTLDGNGITFKLTGSTAVTNGGVTWNLIDPIGFLKLYKYLNITFSSAYTGPSVGGAGVITVGGIGLDQGAGFVGNVAMGTRSYPIVSDNLKSLIISGRGPNNNGTGTIVVQKIWLSNE